MQSSTKSHASINVKHSIKVVLTDLYQPFHDSQKSLKRKMSIFCSKASIVS